MEKEKLDVRFARNYSIITASPYEINDCMSLDLDYNYVDVE